MSKKTKILLSILLILPLLSANSQNPKSKVNKYTIQWVDQFPAIKSEKKGKKTNWLSTILFGKKMKLELIKPNAILRTGTDSYMILDQGNNTIFQVKNNEKKIPKAIKKSKFEFTSLVDMCKISNSEILFTDSRLNKIFKYDEDKKNLTLFNSNVQLKRPTGIAYSKITKEVWVTETGAHQISIFDENGKFIKSVGKRGIHTGEFNFPTSIWIDQSGDIYIVDAMNFRIQIFDKTGQFKTVFGESGNATGYFARSKGIATDSLGNIYVSDALFHTVQIFDHSGNFLYQFGEQGRGKSQFWMPSGIHVDINDFIYIADSYNARIQKFKLIQVKNNE